MKIMSINIPNGTPEIAEFELELIDAFITENSVNLPGPPPPPADSDDQLHTTSVMTGHSSAPVLVPRCTAPKNFDMFSTALTSPRGPRGQRRSTASAVAHIVRPQHTDTEQLEQLLDKPVLVVVEQPKERGMRFRYECEGRSAGSILGASSTDVNKTLPSIELQGPIDRIKNVTVTVSLVTKDIPHRPHPHCLVGKDCSDGICVISFNPHNNRRHSFVNLGIQCVRRKELDASLMKRKKKNIDPFSTGHSKSIEDMDMNVVRLCFQCELEKEDGDRTYLYPVVSNPIYDKKATTTAELKINRLNIVQGPCTGKTEIYMLCDKVQKDDIEIIFSLGNWEAKAEFAQTDVHRQIAIVFKSPPYQEQDLADEVEVNVSLRRISDRMYSEPVKFTYLPHNPDPYEVKRKRKIKSSKFNEDCSVSTDEVMSTPGPAHQFDPFCADGSDCSILPQEEMFSQVPQVLDGIHYEDSGSQLDDTCVSLDPDTVNSLLCSLTDCLGPQNFLQLLNSQDPNSSITDTNLNHMEAGQPPITSFIDPFYNQELPQDLQDIFLRQVKTEDDS
ncbi:transcription factor RelB isoform X1 [Ictalurus punctatus]|uniref:Transcription factor RelB isoform X1 n=2 Tax=Ictalurus punctatus TaxID=7998 RepID=A0A2D0SUU7_ICTPU|nr:transcription factor RelB isoform X1 [Ictalurus punctatus]